MRKTDTKVGLITLTTKQLRKLLKSDGKVMYVNFHKPSEDYETDLNFIDDIMAYTKVDDEFIIVAVDDERKL
tara:strand:+ start:764 stop:979 length:216 start_codon:yes stop_codon:yes gene_type:complete